MKKVYLLCILFCMSLAAGAQTTVTIWATGGPYATGSSTSTTPATVCSYVRSDGTIAVANSSSAAYDGYAVFDLSTIPPTAVISSVTLGVNILGATLSTYGACNTYGHVGDLSTVGGSACPPVAGTTDPNNLYTDCINTTSFGPPVTTIASAATSGAAGSYQLAGTGVGELDFPSSVPLTAWVTNVIHGAGEKGSVSFSAAAVASGALSNVYNFTGDAGSHAVLGPHAPFLTITYCFYPKSVTATISSDTVCTGQTYTLTGTDTGGSYFKWAGPGGWSSIDSSSVYTPTVTSTGVYTFTAFAACGTTTLSTSAYTTTLTVGPSPDTIVNTTKTVCSGNTIFMSDVTTGGVWSSSNTLVATVSATGSIVAGATAGVTVISYLVGLCPSKDTVTVNNQPLAVTGPTAVCASGSTITLSDAVTGGTWSSGTPGNATVNPVTGVVTGVLAGPDIISYITGACTAVHYNITVNPLPTPITSFAPTVCTNTTVQLSDATVPGSWSTSSTAVATVGPTGIVSGVTAAGVTVTYTLPTTCFITTPITVNPVPSAVTGPVAVCKGQTITMSDPSVGGTWSSSATLTATVGSVSGVVTGVNAGVINVSYTFTATGCASTQSVTVDPLPDPIAGASVVCAASSISLSDDITPGGWSSQSTAIATVDPVSGDMTGVSAGTVYISYTLSPTNCYITHTVTVNPLPTAVITPSGPTTFCVGGSVTLNATTGAGYIYQWLSNGNPVGTGTPTYVSNSTELIKLKVTDGNGCTDTSAGTQVTLIPNVVIVAGGPTVFCQTGNVLLSVPLAPGILYQWKLNGADIAGANTNTYAATLNGVYTCDLNVPGGCAFTTPAFTVVVYPLPVPPIYFTGTQLTTTNGYLTYQWFLNSVAIPGATTNVVTPTVNGTYRVRVSDGNSCVGYSTFTINALTVASVNKIDINIYPNPATSMVNIESPISVRAVITGMEGKTVMEQDNATRLNISKLPDGIYMIMLYDNNGNRLIVQKLIKE